MPRKLKLFSGRGCSPRERLFIAAYSRADACRLLHQQYRGISCSSWDRELKEYFSECWGTEMDSVTPVRGVWLKDADGILKCLWTDPLCIPEASRHTCSTCSLAKWQQTDKGRIKKKEAGECTATIPKIDVPICVDPKTDNPSMDINSMKKAIWFDYDKECPYWAD